MWYYYLAESLHLLFEESVLKSQRNTQVDGGSRLSFRNM